MGVLDLIKAAKGVNCSICGAKCDFGTKVPMCTQCRNEYEIDDDFAANMYLTNKDYRKAKDITVKTHRQYAILQEGIRYEEAGEIDKAVEVYKGLVADGWDGSDMYKRLSGIYTERGEIVESILVLEKYVNLAQSLPSANDNKIAWFQKQIDKQKAMIKPER